MAISKVVVVDGNNLIVQIDRGVAGRGITDVQPVEIDNSLYLEFFFTDGTTETVGPVGTIQYIGQSPIVVNASTISLSTVPVTLGGTGQITANAGFNALAPSQTSNTGKYLKTDGTNTSWDLLDISTGDITGTLPVTNGGTGATTASGARTNLAAAASATTISAGTGLSGGGDLTANRTLSIANTGVTAAAYGSASKTLTATVNAQGQLTVLADTNIAITNTQVSGLGTASTLNAGVALGVATLDAGGTVPLSQIPASIQGGVSYQGTWNATTNTPTLTSSVGSKGYYYVVSVAGSTNLNGITSWNIGDWAIFNGTAWEKIDNTDAVTSVNGYTGTVVLTNTDITGFGTMSTQNANNVSITGGSVTGITDLAIADGGTGQSTAAAAITALTGTQVAGRYLRSDGTNAALSAIQAADVPTLNQNTTGTAAGLSATLAIASGGTGQTTANTAFNALAPSQTGNSGKYLTTDGSNTSWATNPLGTVTSVGVSGGTTGLTTSGGPVTTSGTITLAGTLATTNGGTGLTSFTANGVVYASSTSALATGTALTFDGTTLGVKAATTEATNVNIGGGRSGSGFAYLDLIGDAAQAASYSARLIRGNGGANATTSLIHKGTGALEFTASDAGYLTYNINGSEQMRLTSTGLGIGTSSPGAKLDVVGSARVSGVSGTGYQGLRLFGTGTAYNYMQIDNTGGVINFGLENSSGGSLITGTAPYAAVFSTYSNTPIQFGTNNTLRATLDSSGNLGLGVTPSAWTSTHKAYQLQGGGSVYNNGADGYINVANNFYYDGTDWRRVTAAPVSQYLQSSSGHTWGYVGTGAANSVCGFPTTQMTLDASGNLGVGTTSPDIFGRFYTRSIGFSSSGTTSLQINGSTYGTIDLGAGGTRTTSITGSSSEAQLATVTAIPILFTTNNIERARITSSGNFGVGLTNPDSAIEINSSATASARFKVNYNGSALAFLGSYLGIVGSGNATDTILSSQAVLAFGAGGTTERARIDSSGNLIQSAPTTPPSLATNGTMVFNLTSNTNLRVSVRGSDGVTRTANITLA